MRRGKVFFGLMLAVLLSVSLMLFPSGPASAATGTISITPASGPIGTTVTLTGSGFTATNSYTVTFNGYGVASGTTSATGGISTTFLVPSYARGYYIVTVISAGDTTTGQYFTTTPDITLSSYSGYAGDTVTVNGTGFNASSTVTLYFDSGALTSTTTNTSGNFTGLTFTVPAAARGSHTVYASDASGSSSSYSFTVSPKLSVSPGSAAVGSTVSISGTGFAASSAVTFYIDNSAVSTGAVTTSSVGSFTLSSFTIPAMARGSYTVKAQDASSNVATTILAVQQAITATNQSGPAGTTVKITGSGFTANRTITVTYAGNTVSTSPSTITTDATGNFSASFVTPAGPGGAQTINISDGTYTATAAFTVVGSAVITPVTGPVGTTVTVTGTSFNASSQIVVRYDAFQAAITTSDANGSFSTSFEVPVSAVGPHTVAASDSSNTINQTFTVTPVITIEPTSGNAGGNITVKGNGFTAGRAVPIKFDTDQVASVATDASGSFAASFNTPAGTKGGNHSIIVTDGINTLTATFAMDSTSPPVPASVQPPNGIQADALPAFSWTAVTDPSGVTYTFELSTDQTFNAPILSKTGLTTNGYTLTDTEKLQPASKDHPYYWRVKAIDGAANESAWSTPWTFYVGFVLATWAFWVIIGFAILVAGLLGFWLGLRSKLRR